MLERDLFMKALEILDTVERAAFLDRACAGQPELRRSVEELLSIYAQAGETNLQPLIPSSQPPEVTHRYLSGQARGALIAGKYKLLQNIGEGGMGAVYLAEQIQPVKRRVAVKLIKEGLNSAQILARFEAERQALALMDHPHIAKVLDAGTTDDRGNVTAEMAIKPGAGTPFFVMELVKGVPINEFCDTHKLTIPQRLDVFRQICSAVQHAHQKGIIHRDLKPSNILVESHDGKPVPKVIDFGLAKAMSGTPLTERTLFTALGTVAGTPLYMAPEQASFNAIDVDTRADIYALGVILYELLTGSTPIQRDTLRNAALEELLRVIRELEPPTPSKRLSSTDGQPSIAAVRGTEPSQLGRLVKGDLDWIVMKALAKDRDRRYESAIALAQDIERFLNHEPVTAGPPTIGYRLRKLVQRNKPQVVAGAFVLLALIAGICGTTWGFLRASQQARLARQEANKKELALVAEAREHDRAEAERRKAIEFRDQALEALRAATGEDVEKLIGGKPELGVNERQFLASLAGRWEQFAQREGADELSRAVQAEGQFRVALLWGQMGRLQEAKPRYEAARDLLVKLTGQFPTVANYQSLLGKTHHNLGSLLRDLGDLAAARVEYQGAREVQVRLIEQFPAEPAYQQDLALTRSNLGTVLRDLGEPRLARAEYDQACDLQTGLVNQFPNVATIKEVLASTYNNRGVLFKEMGEHDLARTNYQEARELYRQLVDLIPTAPGYRLDLARTYVNQGNLLVESGQRASAQADYETARELMKTLVAQFPAVPAYLQQLATVHNSLGVLHVGLGRIDPAGQELEQARVLLAKLVDAFPAIPRYKQELAATCNNLGLLQLQSGHAETARARF